jgi:hypothetical protein
MRLDRALNAVSRRIFLLCGPLLCGICYHKFSAERSLKPALFSGEKILRPAQGHKARIFDRSGFLRAVLQVPEEKTVKP